MAGLLPSRINNKTIHGDTEQQPAACMREIWDGREYLKFIAAVTAFLEKLGIIVKGTMKHWTVTIREILWNACNFMLHVSPFTMITE